ncbi:MAG: TonB-dependent receptor plug domain-containing protein [Sphingomonadales bacterium]
MFAQQRSIILIYEEGEPIVGADVLADFRPQASLQIGKTDTNGKFFLNNSGAFKLTVISPSDSMSGFEGTFTALDNQIIVTLKQKNLLINPVTITGATGPRAIADNPYLIRVIPKEKIAQMGAQNLGELLLNEANIQVGQDAVMGSNAIMQGIGGQDIKILINGIPVIGRINGNVDLGQIVLNNVERIEIIEGPMSVVYGTDALGGVINVITKNPGNQRFNTRLNVFHDYMTAFSNYNYDVNVTGKMHKKMPFTMNAGRYYFAGRDFNSETRSFDWKPKSKQFADASLFLNTKNSNHRITTSLFQEKLTDRSDAEYSLANVTGYNSVYATTRLDNTIHSVFKINTFSRFEWQNAFNYFNRSKITIKRNLVSGAETPYRPEDQDTSVFTMFNSRGVYTFRNPVNPVSWTIGYDLMRETALGKRIPAQLPGITDVAVFGAMEYSPSREWQVRPSLRILHNSRFGNPIITSVFGDRIKMAPLIPSLQLKYNLSKHLSFRGSYAKGFRAPSLKELNFYFVDMSHNVHGNDSLKAEISDNFILSFDYRHPFSSTSGAIFSFSLFNNIIRNKINLALIDLNTNYYTYINIGRFRSQGLSTNFEFHNQKFTMQLSGTLLTVYDLLEQADSVNQSAYLNGQFAFNLTRKFGSQKASVSLFSRYTSPTIGYMENNERYRTAGFYLLDLTAQKAFPKAGLNISCGVKNILGVTTLASTRRNLTPHSEQGMNVNITPGRTLFLRFSYDIN